jgi:hypothetical protein
MIYNIKKGNHYSLHLPKFHCKKNNLIFNVEFNKNCLYTINDEDKFDINKLYGISWGNHMNNSFRIGWRKNIFSENLEIFLYSHNNGHITFEYLCMLDVEKKYTFLIHFSYLNNTIMTYNLDYNIQKEISFRFPKFKGGYYLFPYFGGNKVALHDMNIEIK